jgi:uncharacterized membrane protein
MDAARKGVESNNGAVGSLVQRNIETLVAERRRAERDRSVPDQIADLITAFSGSLTFVYLHLAWLVIWVVWNLGLIVIEPFDPYPFGLLTMIASVEAIFLSTFVLVSQNRQAAINERRADLGLQISLLSEQQVTHVLRICDAIAQQIGTDVNYACDTPELKRDINPEEVLREIQHVEDHHQRR